MNVNELLDTIEDALEEGANVPLSGGKRIVDVEPIRDYLDEVRAALPGSCGRRSSILTADDRTGDLRDEHQKNEAEKDDAMPSTTIRAAVPMGIFSMAVLIRNIVLPPHRAPKRHDFSGLIIQQEHVNLALKKKTRKGLAKRKKYAIIQAGK